MKGLYRNLALVALATCVLSAGALADQVVLKSGPRITGTVTVKRDAVSIENEFGTLTLPLGRVERVILSSEEPALRRAEAKRAAENEPRDVGIPESVKPAETPKPVAPADETWRVPGPWEVLGSRIDVSFDGAPLVDAMTYVQEVTGGNFAYATSDLDADPTPVTLTLRDVTVSQVLKILLEGRGLGWSVRGNTILVGKSETTRRMILRVYDVRDLVVNTQDKPAARTPTAAATTGAYGYGGYGGRYDITYGGGYGRGYGGGYGRGYGGGYERGYGGGYGGGYGRGYGGYRGGYGPGAISQTETASERVRGLATLITQTVRPKSWQSPAVVVIGGADVGPTAVEETAQVFP